MAPGQLCADRPLLVDQYHASGQRCANEAVFGGHLQAPRLKAIIWFALPVAVSLDRAVQFVSPFEEE